MALVKRGKYYYGDTQADIRSEVLRYSTANAFPSQQFADPVCTCGNAHFWLALDETEGAAIRKCARCELEHPIGDSADYLEDAHLEECACPCGNDKFELTLGVSLYDNSEDVRWLYVGCRCTVCGLTAVYGDWKNDFNGYKAFLARV